jgi:hypothetical protein
MWIYVGLSLTGVVPGCGPKGGGEGADGDESGDDATEGSGASELDTTTDDGDETTSDTTDEAEADVGETDDETDDETDGDDDDGGLEEGLVAKSLMKLWGSSAFCAVRPDNTMVCWGGNVGISQLFNPPPADKTIKSVNRESSVVVLEDGELHAFFVPTGQEPQYPNGPYELAAGTWEAGCGVRPDQSLSCWGVHEWDGPVPVQGPFAQFLMTPTELNCGVCAVRPSGELLCWKPASIILEDDFCEWGEAEMVVQPPGLFKPFGFASNWGVTVITADGIRAGWLPPDQPVAPHQPAWDPGGWIETWTGGYDMCGLNEGGELLCHESNVSDLEPLFPGTYRNLIGAKQGGCAIREADSRVVCWGKNPYRPPMQHPFDPPNE